MVMLGKARPTSPSELEDFLQDKVAVGEAFADPVKAKATIEEYRKAANKTDPELARQVEEAKKKGLTEFMEKNGLDPKQPTRRIRYDDGPASEGDVYKGLGLTPLEKRFIAATGKGPGMAGAGKFKSLGEFFAMANAHRGWRSGQQLDDKIKALGEGAGDQGGFLVPEEYRAELLKLSLEQALVRPRARVIPMARETLRFTAIRSTSHASTGYGGITAQWVPESGDIAAAN